MYYFDEKRGQVLQNKIYVRVHFVMSSCIFYKLCFLVIKTNTQILHNRDGRLGENDVVTSLCGRYMLFYVYDIDY